MANYNQLKTRAQQVRDEQTIGGNTALRVGQLLMDMVDAESETVDNIVELFTGTEGNPVIPTLPNPGLLHWLQSPIVALVSMGEALDGDAGAVVQEGDLYYYNHSGYQIFVKGAGSLPGTGYKARQKVLYFNKYTGKLYEWTGADMSEIVIAGTGGGGGNVTIEEGLDYIDITIDDNVSVIEVSTQSIVMSGQTKTATFTVSGHNLTAPIRINGGNAYFSKSPSSISPVGGIVEATTVTVTFGGSTDDTDDLIVSSVGAASKTVHVTYTAVEGPNIVVSPATLSFKAAEDETETKQVSVQGSQLEADVTVSSDDSAFAVSLDGTTFNSSVTIPKATAMAGATVYVRYTAGSTGSTGTLTLESTGATSKTVDLAGAVISLTVSESSLSFNTTVGTPATQTFTVQGTNLTQDISISASGTGFSVSPATIDKDNAATAQTVTVTYNPNAAGTNTGTVTIQSSGLSETIDLSGTAESVPEFSSSNSYQQQIGGIYYKVIMNGETPTTNLQVCNSSYSGNAAANSYSGDVVIPSTVSALLDGNQTPFSVTEIRANAFSSCSSLNSVIVPNSVTSLGNYCFSGNNAMKKIVLGSGCTDLSHNEFYNNNSQWEEIDFGENVASVAGNGFKLKDTAIVTLRYAGYNGTTPKRVNFNSAPFSNTNGTRPCAASLYVPSTHVQSYKNSNYWGNPNGGANQQFQQANIFAITE